MTRNVKTLMLVCFASAMSIALTGCKYERDERDSAFYNDVGETDIDRRVFASDRKGTADMAVPENTRVAQKRRHFNEVGETSLDFGAQQASEQPRKQDKKVKPVSMVKPAETQPVVYAKPADTKAQAPVRYVPAPAPAPEYRRQVNVGETELGN